MSVRPRWVLAPVLLVACIAGVSIALIERASRTTPQRVADWLDTTSCASVSRRRLAMRGADRGLGVERAMARRADRVELIDCENAGGAIEYMRFGSAGAMSRAIQAATPAHRLCVHGDEALASVLLFEPRLLRVYCDRLGGSMREPR